MRLLIRRMRNTPGSEFFVPSLAFAGSIMKNVHPVRDALIAETTEERSRGRAFGFNRAMDHLGAAIGPLIAFGFFWWMKGNFDAEKEQYLASVANLRQLEA